LISEDYIASTIDKSMINLSQVLSGKVDKEILLSNIKYDTLMVEKQNGFLLLGVNVSSVNKKEN
jgi:ferredoxin-fold anticodon binding domain-containing protein